MKNKKNNEDRNKFFNQVLREKLSEHKLTYEKFAEQSGVSKSYLTEILVHHRVPSMEIIEKIAKTLNLKLVDIREYRILRVMKDLGVFYASLNSDDIEELENFIKKITNKSKGEYIEVLGKGMVYDIEFEPDYLINISDLSDHQVKILKTVAREFRKENEKDIIEIQGDDVLSNR